jgi:hypothetical protein
VGRDCWAGGKFMEDADHGASPTTVEVHDKEHYRPKNFMHRRIVFYSSSTATQKGYPNPNAQSHKFQVLCIHSFSLENGYMSCLNYNRNRKNAYRCPHVRSTKLWFLVYIQESITYDLCWMYAMQFYYLYDVHRVRVVTSLFIKKIVLDKISLNIRSILMNNF